jgi:hypothetical protein
MADLTLRSVKGSPLTNAELDSNFEYFTGSHAITGSLTISGSIIPAEVNGTLGTADHPWKELFIDGGTIIFISGSSSGSINFTSGSGFNFTGGGLTISGSPVVTSNSTGSNATTGSNNFTGSQTISGSLTTTGSVNVTGSINVNGSTVVTSNSTGSLVVNTSSFATTGSNIFIGNQTISGSILISGSLIPNVSGSSTTSSFSLGSATNAWKDLWVSNGTINFLNSAGQVQASLGAGSSGTTFTGGTNISGQLKVTPTSVTSSQPARIYQNQDPSCNFRLSTGTNMNVDLYYYGIWYMLPFDRTYTSYFIIGTPADEDSYTVYLPPYKNSGHAPGKPVTVYNMNSNPATLSLKVLALAQSISAYNPSDPKNITGLVNTAGLISGSYGQVINNFYSSASIPSGYKGTFELINVGSSQALSASFASYPTVNEGIANNYDDSTSMGDGNELRWKLVSILPI